MKYIVFVLFFGISFCQDTLKLNYNDITYTGYVEDIFDDRIKFHEDGEMYGSIVKFSQIKYLSTPETILIKDGELLVPHYAVSTNDSTSDKVLFKPGALTKAGGICIALAGALGYSNMISEFDGDYYDENFQPTTEFNDYTDLIENKSKVMYILLLIGGILIAMDQ